MCEHIFDIEDNSTRQRHGAVLNWFVRFCQDVVLSKTGGMFTCTVNEWIECHGGWVSDCRTSK